MRGAIFSVSEIRRVAGHVQGCRLCQQRLQDGSALEVCLDGGCGTGDRRIVVPPPGALYFIGVPASRVGEWAFEWILSSYALGLWRVRS